MTFNPTISFGLRSGLISLRRSRKRRNLPVKRAQFPPGPDGQRAYNTAYQRAKRRQDGLQPRVREIPVCRMDYPRTVAGFKQYRHDYFKAWREAHPTYGTEYRRRNYRRNAAATAL